MEHPIDIDFRANNTPQQLAEYYLPFLISKKIENTQVRAALRNEHKFDAEKVRETMIILAELEFDFHRKVPTTSKFILYFYLVLAFVMIVAGVVLTFVFWKMGFLVLATLFLVASGFGLLLRTNKQIRLLEEV